MCETPYKTVDTLSTMRDVAMFSSNKQNELCKKMGLSQKMEHEGYDLWKKCFRGDPPSLNKMEAYNKQDIMGAEELYVRIRPWVKSHPNMGLFVEGDGYTCPNCGESNLRWMDKFYVTSVNKYSCFRCDNCNAVGRSRHTAMDKDDKRGLLQGVAR